MPYGNESFLCYYDCMALKAQLYVASHSGEHIARNETNNSKTEAIRRKFKKILKLMTVVYKIRERKF